MWIEIAKSITSECLCSRGRNVRLTLIRLEQVAEFLFKPVSAIVTRRTCRHMV